MSDLEIYDHIRGEELERRMARRREVQTVLRWNAAEYAVRAEAILNSARERTGASQIMLERGDYTDWYVVLDDERAMDIEFGRKLPEKKKGSKDDSARKARSRAVAPLRRAIGREVK